MKKKTSKQRRLEIIESAVDIILNEGVQRLTIKNIAGKNSISEAAIYRHFKDKEAILVSLIENFEINLTEAVETALGKEKKPLAALAEMMKTHLAFTEKRKGIFFSIIAESVHFDNDVLRGKILYVIERYRGRVKEILSRAREQEAIRADADVDSASLVFFGLIQTAILHYTLSGYQVPPVEQFHSLWDIFLKGVK